MVCGEIVHVSESYFGKTLKTHWSSHCGHHGCEKVTYQPLVYKETKVLNGKWVTWDSFPDQGCWEGSGQHNFSKVARKWSFKPVLLLLSFVLLLLSFIVEYSWRVKASFGSLHRWEGSFQCWWWFLDSLNVSCFPRYASLCELHCDVNIFTKNMVEVVLGLCN